MLDPDSGQPFSSLWDMDSRQPRKKKEYWKKRIIPFRRRSGRTLTMPGRLVPNKKLAVRLRSGGERGPNQVISTPWQPCWPFPNWIRHSQSGPIGVHLGPVLAHGGDPPFSRACFPPPKDHSLTSDIGHRPRGFCGVFGFVLQDSLQLASST